MDIFEAGRFKKDKKKFINSGNLPADFLEKFTEVINCFLNGNKIPRKYQDHKMKGDFNNSRNCHICPDIVLIYSKNETEVQLKRLFSHSEFMNKKNPGKN